MKAMMPLLLLAGLSTAAPAWAETYNCDGCTSAQVKQMADKKLIANGRPAREARLPLYLVDMAQGVTYKWQYNVKVTTVPGSGDGDTTQITAWTTALTPESDIVAAVKAVKATGPTPGVNAAGDGRDYYDTNHPGLPGTVYDSVSDSRMENTISDRLNSRSPGIAQKLINLVNIIKSGFNGTGVTLSVVWHYPDNSTAIFIYDQNTKTWKRDPTSARDSDKNFVPLVKSDYSGNGGTQDFTFTNFNNYVNSRDRAGGMGIKIVYLDSKPPVAGNVIGITCSNNSTCAIYVISK